VLVVDDDPDVLARARDVLSAAGHGVTTLEDPTGFWALLDRIRPDLVVLDVQMPEVDGIALCGTLRADARWAATPVVFLTAAVAADAVGELFTAGADDYVAKPFAGPELVARIGNRLDRARLPRAAALTDPVTGLELRGPAHARMRRVVRHADRLGQPVSIGLLGLEDLPDDVDAADSALTEAGRTLRAALGPDDAGARWGDDTLLFARLGGGNPSPGGVLARIVEELRAAGHEMQGIRLDSGDLAYLSAEARDRLLIRLSLAGHPPGLVIRADGAIEPAGVYGTMLAAVAEPEFPPGLVAGGVLGRLEQVQQLRRVAEDDIRGLDQCARSLR
jgi:CheY-like chemotaxis protein